MSRNIKRGPSDSDTNSDEEEDIYPKNHTNIHNHRQNIGDNPSDKKLFRNCMITTALLMALLAVFWAGVMYGQSQSTDTVNLHDNIREADSKPIAKTKEKAAQNSVKSGKGKSNQKKISQKAKPQKTREQILKEEEEMKEKHRIQMEILSQVAQERRAKIEKETKARNEEIEMLKKKLDKEHKEKEERLKKEQEDHEREFEKRRQMLEEMSNE